MKIEEAKRRIEILLTDDCNCSECLKNKEAYKTVLAELEKKDKKLNAKEIEQKESILDKVTEECRKQMKEYEDSILEIFPQKLLNIIEGEKNNE